MTAIISDCGKYRYTLERAWSRDPRYLMYIMLNPSTADAEKDDPTIRRCIGFAKLLGYDGILVGNLYAFRATNPKELRNQGNIVGPDNDKHLLALANRAQQIVCAWGQPGPEIWRARDVRQLLSYPLYALGFTKGGYPRHPLMLPKTARPIEFS